MSRRTPPDLFQLFPDLPWLRCRTAGEQLEKVYQQVSRTRARAIENIRRQQTATELVRTALSARRRRH